jgi:hypothetical protein
VINLIILTSLSFSDSRETFELESARQSERGFYIGADKVLFDKVHIQSVDVLFKVTKGGQANGLARLDLRNISNEDLSPTFLMILPSDSIITWLSPNAT